MSMYKNPINVAKHDKDHFGDPFIMKYDGLYYLYPSAKNGTVGVVCYVSKDLVNFEYRGKILSDEVAVSCFAPEVVYHDGKFYLVTSPEGKGHYLFVASSPLGEFHRVSDNIENMIDGSLFIDSLDKMHLLRANHCGISLLNIENDGRTHSRVDLNAPMSGWTEGPGLLYNDGYYFLTYTGNNVSAKGYRVSYSFSRYFNRDFVRGFNDPLLISTEGKHMRFGHSSTVIGPDLDSRYLAYHELSIVNGSPMPRRLRIDRASFFGSMMVVNYNFRKNESPKRPSIEGYGIYDGFLVEGNRYFYSKSPRIFTLEVTIKGKENRLVLSTTKKEGDLYITFGDDITLKLADKTIFIVKNNFDFIYMHAVRVIYDRKTLELLIDGAPIFRIEENFIPHVGFVLSSKDDVSYNAISKFAFNSSSNSYATLLPGYIFPSGSSNITIDDTDGVKIAKLRIGERLKWKLNCDDCLYFLSLYARVVADSKIAINGKTAIIYANSSEFDFEEHQIGDFSFADSRSLEIELIEGEIELKFIEAREFKDHLAVKFSTEDTDRDQYSLSIKDSLLNSLTFKVEMVEERLYQKAGALFGVSSYSDEVDQARYPLVGFFVGIENSLLVLDKFDYGSTRIYDIPVKLEKINEIKAVIDGVKVEIYLNGVKKISTNVPYMLPFGRYGFYKAVEAQVVLSELVIEEKKDE